MRRTHRSNRNYFRYAAIAFSIVFLMSSVLFAVKLWEKSQDKADSPAFLEEIIEFDGKSYVLKDIVETFLVMGLDKFGGESDTDGFENDMQADFIMLLVFDNEEKTCTALQINRDTIVPVNVLDLAGNKLYSVDLQIARSHTEVN